MPHDDIPPLILGATGRIGRAFRSLWQAGLWPSTREPLWQHRPGHAVEGNAIVWDMTGPPPADYRLHMTRGIVVLAGVTAGDEAAVAANTAVARAALRLCDSGVAGPVLLMSSAAVYGRAAGVLGEDTAPAPVAPYGAAKAAMEAEFAGTPGVTCLRLANVAGCDSLFGSMAAGPVRLDRFADGTSPQRSYVGPVTLAGALLRLAAMRDLPPVLNLASPGGFSMEAILEAAGAEWSWTPAPDSAIRSVTLDTARLSAICPLPPASAGTLVAEARAAGWRPGR